MTDSADIKLQGREYRVACAPEEKARLLEAAAMLDAKMSEIAAATKSTGERLAVMAALNLAHELLARAPAAADAQLTSLKQSPKEFDAAEAMRRIEAMEAQLDKALAGQDALF